MNADQVLELFKWMTLINAGILILSTFLIMGLKGIVGRQHGRFFGIPAEKVAVVSYAYLGGYKLLFLVFNLVPFLSLLIIR